MIFYRRTYTQRLDMNHRANIKNIDREREAFLTRLKIDWVND